MATFKGSSSGFLLGWLLLMNLLSPLSLLFCVGDDFLTDSPVIFSLSVVLNSFMAIHLIVFLFLDLGSSVSFPNLWVYGFRKVHYQFSYDLSLYTFCLSVPHLSGC